MTTKTAGTEPALREQIQRIVTEARQASRQLAKASSDQKNAALRAMAQALGLKRKEILDANAKDVDAARRHSLSSALIDRLTLTEKRVEEMIASIEAVVQLPDPVGEVIRMWRRPNGLLVR